MSLLNYSNKAYTSHKILYWAGKDITSGIRSFYEPLKVAKEEYKT